MKRWSVFFLTISILILLVGCSTTDENSKGSMEDKTESSTVSDDVVKDIFVLINHQPVKLSGKKKYVLVDIFDFYDFDLSKPQGSDVVLKLNGQKADYLAPLKDGDLIDLYWEG